MRADQRLRHTTVLAAVLAPPAAAVAAALTDRASGSQAAFVVGTLVADGILVAGLWAASRRGFRLRDLVGRPRLDDVVSGLALTLAVYLIAIATVTLAAMAGIEPPQTVAVPPSAIFVVVVALSRLVIGPVVEEAFYRGLLLTELRSRLGAWSVPVQGVAFGLAHFRSLSPPDLLTMASATVVGVVLGAAVYRWRRLLPAVLAHALVNAA